MTSTDMGVKLPPALADRSMEQRATSAPQKSSAANPRSKRRVRSAKRDTRTTRGDDSNQKDIDSNNPPQTWSTDHVTTGVKSFSLPRIKTTRILQVNKHESPAILDTQKSASTPCHNNNNSDTPSARKPKAGPSPSTPTEFIAMHGGTVKAVVDSNRKQFTPQRPSSSSRRPRSLQVASLNSLTSMLPWNNPKFQKKRIPIVAEPPFEFKKKNLSVRELANAHQRKKRSNRKTEDHLKRPRSGTKPAALPPLDRDISEKSLSTTNNNKEMEDGRVEVHYTIQQGEKEGEGAADPLEQSIRLPGKKGLPRPQSLNLSKLKVDTTSPSAKRIDWSKQGMASSSAVANQVESEQANLPATQKPLPLSLDLAQINISSFASSRGEEPHEYDDCPNEDLEITPPDELEETYEFTASGAFNIQGFQIQENGITRAPYGKLPSGDNCATSDLIKLSVLGRGASGVVHEMLHVPSLSLVAVKSIPCFEQSKRHQMIKELKALYSNLVPISASSSTSRTPAMSTPDPKSSGLAATTAGSGTKSMAVGFSQSVKKREESCGPELDCMQQEDCQPACPYIVAFHDAFISPKEGNVNIIMEYMDGGSLQDVVDAGGCDCEVVLANIAESVLRALLFLHNRKQIHRDIKPSNLLINHKGEVKISDFGIIRDVTDEQLHVNTFIGTMIYMSPERISGSAYSFSSDIWSYGLSLMTLALGRFPFSMEGGYWGMLQALNHAPMPTLPNDRFSPDFVDFVNQTLEKDPSNRPSAQELLEHPFLVRARADQSRTPKAVTEQTTVDGKEKLEEICKQLVEHKLHKIFSQMEDQGVLNPQSSGRTPQASGTPAGNSVGNNKFSMPAALSQGASGQGKPTYRKRVGSGSGGKKALGELAEMGRCTCSYKGKCAFCMTSSFDSNGQQHAQDGEGFTPQQHFYRLHKVRKYDCATLADQMGLSVKYVTGRMNHHLAQGNEYLRRYRLYLL